MKNILSSAKRCEGKYFLNALLLGSRHRVSLLLAATILTGCLFTGCKKESNESSLVEIRK